MIWRENKLRRELDEQKAIVKQLKLELRQAKQAHSYMHDCREQLLARAEIAADILAGDRGWKESATTRIAELPAFVKAKK
jgi:hypothetical protein